MSDAKVPRRNARRCYVTACRSGTVILAACVTPWVKLAISSEWSLMTQGCLAMRVGQPTACYQ